SKTNPFWDAAFFFLGFGIGVTNLALRRLSTTSWVGCPVSSSSQCRVGYSYGELRIGRSKNGLDIPPAPDLRLLFLTGTVLRKPLSHQRKCRPYLKAGITPDATISIRPGQAQLNKRLIGRTTSRVPMAQKIRRTAKTRKTGRRGWSGAGSTLMCRQRRPFPI